MPVVIAIAVVCISLAGLLIWRWLDQQADQRVRLELIRSVNPTSTGAVFDESMISDLPEAVQRYFRYSIDIGTPLSTVAEIEMSGELCLGTKQSPNCRSMVASQLLAPPQGLVWSLQAGPLSGSDAATPEVSWTRFWLFNVLPVVRVGGTRDHLRSAFGRVVSEGAFWVPASLLPSPSVVWNQIDASTVRASVSLNDLRQDVQLTLAASGQPTKVVISRWSNENPEKSFREQPFGGELSEFKQFEGYRVPTRVIGGNHIDTPDYFPFYRATISSIRFL